MMKMKINPDNRKDVSNDSNGIDADSEDNTDEDKA